MGRLAAVEPDLQLLRPGEAGFAPDQDQVLGVFETLLVAPAEGLHDVPLAPAYLDHIDGHRAVSDAVVRRAPVQVGYPGAGDHRLGGGAALVDAGAADVLALYYRRLVSGAGEGAGQWAPALAGADHDGVVVLFGCHGGVLLPEVYVTDCSFLLPPMTS